MNTPDLIGSREAADILGVSQRTLLRRVRDGHLTPAHIADGGHGVYLYDRAAVEALAANGDAA